MQFARRSSDDQSTGVLLFRPGMPLALAESPYVTARRAELVDDLCRRGRRLRARLAAPDFQPQEELQP
jgi:hypothetical protein